MEYKETPSTGFVQPPVAQPVSTEAGYFCRFCGASLLPDSMFCSKCGKQL